MTRGTWRKPSFSGAEDNCFELPGTLDAVRDSKNPGVVLPVDMRTFVRLVKADRVSVPTS